MEENKTIRRVIKKPAEQTVGSNSGNGTDTFFKALTVIIFIMVFVIFVRGFNTKGTVREESGIIQKTVNEQVLTLKREMENAREIDKNEILSAFALYSRLDAQSLKEREEYHKKQQEKYEGMAKQYNQGLNNLVKEIKTKKDSIK